MADLSGGGNGGCDDPVRVWAARQNERQEKSAWEFFKQTVKLVAGGSWKVARPD